MRCSTQCQATMQDMITKDAAASANSPPLAPHDGATVVITHRVREGRHADYERWLDEIGPVCRAAVGHLDWQIVRPIPGIAISYTIIIRFDTVEHLLQWITSQERKRLISKIQPLLAAGDTYTIHSGLDFWFLPQGMGPKAPVRWKQFLVTWSAIYPLVLVVPMLVLPLMHELPGPHNRYLDALPITAIVVLLMVYAVMPTYTKLVRRWLYR